MIFQPETKKGFVSMLVNANILANLACAVEEAVVNSSKVAGNQAPERQYGYLTVLNRENGQILLVQAIGDIPDKKADQYRQFSMEKAERLLSNPDHVSSWQSRLKSDEKYGGAIAARHLIISFSGLKEYADESVCIWGARKVRLLNKKEVDGITDVSETSWFLEGLQ